MYKTLKKIDIYQIYKAIYNLSNRWILDLANIFSKILKKTICIIILYIYLIINACFKIGYCLYHFNKLVTIILYKHNKDNSTKTKYYCLLILLNTLSKMLEIIPVKRFGYLISKHVFLHYIYISKYKSTFINYIYYYLFK